MWFQIIDAIAKLVNLFDNGRKLQSIKKKIELGRKLTDIHQTISRLQRNAKLIENLFNQIINTEYDSYSYRYCDYSTELHKLFQNQLYELHSLRRSLSDNNISTIIDIYDEDIDKNDNENSLGIAIAELADFKISLIEFLEVIVEQHMDSLMVPSTYDLMEIEAFRKAKYDTPKKWQDFLFLLAYDHMLSNSPFFKEFPLSPRLYQYDRYDKNELVERFKLLKHQSALLLKQSIDFGSSNRLHEQKVKLGGIIRKHFSIEEVA